MKSVGYFVVGAVGFVAAPIWIPLMLIAWIVIGMRMFGEIIIIEVPHVLRELRQLLSP